MSHAKTCSCVFIFVEEHNNHLKLEIHGRLGLIYHAILERTNAYVNDNNNPLGDRQLETLE